MTIGQVSYIFVAMIKIFTYIILVLALFSCTTIKEVTKTEVQIKTDTLYVASPEYLDSVKAEWVDSLTVSGTLIDTVKGDTVVTVKYLPGKEKFIIKKYPEIITVEKIDTVVIHTTNLTEEPTFLEEWWWLFLIVGVVVIIIILKR